MMDLMKELIHERSEPHKEDIGTWRQKTEDCIKQFKDTVGMIAIEDPDSDLYSKERAVKVVNELRKMCERIEKETEKAKSLYR